MMDDEVGSLVEKLKPQFVTKWLKTVCDVRLCHGHVPLPKTNGICPVSGG